MNVHMNAAGVNFLGFLVTVVGIAVTVFWMYVAWRAMRAHERLANASEAVARKFQDRI